MKSESMKQVVVILAALAIAYTFFHVPESQKPEIQIMAWDKYGRPLNATKIAAIMPIAQTYAYAGGGTQAGSDVWAIFQDGCVLNPPTKCYTLATIGALVEGDNTGTVSTNYALDVTSDWTGSLAYQGVNQWEGLSASATPGNEFIFTQFLMNVEGMPELTPIYVEVAGSAPSTTLTKVYWRQLTLDYYWRGYSYLTSNTGIVFLNKDQISVVTASGSLPGSFITWSNGAVEYLTVNPGIINGNTWKTWIYNYPRGWWVRLSDGAPGASYPLGPGYACVKYDASSQPYIVSCSTGGEPYYLKEFIQVSGSTASMQIRLQPTVTGGGRYQNPGATYQYLYD